MKANMKTRMRYWNAGFRRIRKRTNTFFLRYMITFQYKKYRQASHAKSLDGLCAEFCSKLVVLLLHNSLISKNKSTNHFKHALAC
ncbi:hypothetical protein QE390_005095 [Siphonobacter sp. SORGH_AS 1065]|nr:hypothetical protein [Siphonobacter sp. SORGH_AS_1065]